MYRKMLGLLLFVLGVFFICHAEADSLQKDFIYGNDSVVSAIKATDTSTAQAQGSTDPVALGTKEIGVNTADPFGVPQPVASFLSTGAKMFLSGKTELVEGQMLHSYMVGAFQSTEMHPVWVNNSYIQLRLDAYVSSRFHIIAAPEIRLWGNTYDISGEQDVRARPAKQFFTASIADGEGVYSIGDTAMPFLQIAAGVMPIKYNDDAYNLGEYLFRTGCYPSYIITTFDKPYATLPGLRVSSVLFGHLKQELLFTMETQVQPLYDWSLSYLVGYKLPSFFDIGAGISLYRFLPIDDSVTTPKSSIGDNFTKEDGSTGYYTFKGVKLMGRLSLDPKGFLPPKISGLMSSEDGKIFAEIAVLGTKNYTAYEQGSDSGTYKKVESNNYYKDISKRMPIMFGMNIPTFKLLNVLSIQGEWFEWQYGNSLYSTQDYKLLIPVPFIINISDHPSDYSTYHWSWSIYAKKHIVNGFNLIGQMAHDHTFNDCYYEYWYCPVQAFNSKGGWNWKLKLQYTF
jgi:hypothetical protein